MQTNHDLSNKLKEYSSPTPNLQAWFLAPKKKVSSGQKRTNGHANLAHVIIKIFSNTLFKHNNKPLSKRVEQV